MLGLLAPTFIAVVAASFLSGSLRELFETRVRWWPVVLVAFGVELGLFNPPMNSQVWAIQLGPWIWLATKLALLAALLRNALPGARMVGWPWLGAAGGGGVQAAGGRADRGHPPPAGRA